MRADPRERGMSVSIEVSDELVERIAQRAAEIVADRQPNASTWLNTESAAKYIDAPVSRVHDLVGLGRIVPRRDGRRLLFRRQDLDAYLEEQR
jgi:excisionase family DNA binding protein